MKQIFFSVFLLFLVSCGQGSATQTEPAVTESEAVVYKTDSAAPKVDTASVSEETGFKSYAPCSFSVSLPAGFSLQAMEEETNLDYCDYSVKTKDGFEIIQLHSLLGSKFETSAIKELYETALAQSELSITYKTQKGNWFVISGTNKSNGNIVYWKRVAGNNFISDLHIEYPKSRESEIVQHIGAIAGSFTSE